MGRRSLFDEFLTLRYWRKPKSRERARDRAKRWDAAHPRNPKSPIAYCAWCGKAVYARPIPATCPRCHHGASPRGGALLRGRDVPRGEPMRKVQREPGSSYREYLGGDAAGDSL